MECQFLIDVVRMCDFHMLCRLCHPFVVCDEFNEFAWYHGLYQLSDKCVYVYCVESFAHIQCYSDCSRKGSHFVNRCTTALFTVCSAVIV